MQCEKHKIDMEVEEQSLGKLVPFCPKCRNDMKKCKGQLEVVMKQSDILNFAINGVRKEIEEGVAEVKRLQCVLAELLEHDKTKQEGFVPVHEWEIKDD